MKLIKHMFILSLVIFRLFFYVLELIRLAKIIPRQIWVQLTQLVRIQILSELPEQDHVIFDQVKSKAVALFGLEILCVFIELECIFHQEVNLVLLGLQSRLLLWEFLVFWLYLTVSYSYIVIILHLGIFRFY